MILQRKKDGGPNVKYFESIELNSSYEAIIKWLQEQKNYRKVSL